MLAACASPHVPRPAPPVVTATPVHVDNQLFAVPLPETPDRLPHAFEPTRYAAHLQVDPARAVFSGTIEITGTITEPTAVIWIQAEDLYIERVTASGGGTSVELVATQVKKKGWVALRAVEPFASGGWTLAIRYRGLWTDTRDERAYRAGWPDPEAEAEGGFRQHVGSDHYVFTMFEPDYARRVFPCFDEPDRKVPWQLTLDVPETMVAASNTPIERETPLAPTASQRQPTKTVRFAPTQPIPSYLVAFAVGPFDVVDAGTSKSGIPIRVLTQRGDSARAAHAAISAPQLLDRIESWLGVPFPYPKLDFVAVPQTASWWGAMENPGIVTFHAMSLDDPAMFDSNCAHEIAHHWFGDLVTPTAWDDIWLNESFAYWIGARFSNERRFDVRDTDVPFVVRNLQTPRDEIGSSKAFISVAFMAIHKGTRFLAALEGLLGRDQFVRVLRRYLTAHAHGSVTTADLRAALADEAGETVALLLDRYAYRNTATLDLDLRCDARGARVDVRGFETTGFVCFAYDRDGTRAERCGQVQWGSAAIELPARRCPRWILPSATEDIVLSQTQLEALRDHGLAQLTAEERSDLMSYVLGSDPTKGRLRLSYIEKLVPLATRETQGWLANWLLMVDAQVPPDLRARWNAWLAAVFAKGAPSLAVVRDSHDQNERAEAMSLVTLLLDAHEPAAVRDALTYLPELDKLDDSTRSLVLRAAVIDKPSLAEQLVTELAKASSKRMDDIAFALVRAPDLLDLMKRHVAAIKRLPFDQKMRLLGRLCDETRRGDIEELAKQLVDRWDPFLLRDVEWCFAQRKRFEPELRAFLSSAAGAAKLPHTPN